MSFWSSLFGKKNNSQEFSDNYQKEESVKQKTPNDTPAKDSCGWITSRSGVKLKIGADISGSINDMAARDIPELGYNLGEIFTNSDYDLDHFKIGYFEIVTNKLIGICCKENKMMSPSEIKSFEIEFSKRFGFEEDEDLQKGIENKSISQSFLEKICQAKCVNNKVSNDKYIFIVEDGFLVDYKSADGYSYKVRDILNIDAYHSEAARWYNNEEDIINEINLQAECAACISLDIMQSNETKAIFSYPNGYCNYIAIAAHFKQYDVLLDDFINSTHGKYEVRSKETSKGENITKIKAYGFVETFIDGHSIRQNALNQMMSDDDSTGQGYVYVMINPSLPDMVKIGKTTKDPNERAKELSTATGVPTPFVVVFYKPFTNCDAAELTIHNYLEDQGYRVSENREFFNIPVNDAINVVQTLYNIDQEQGEE
ncbi:MAG: GIY-YIG nuclease family protein [Bacteroidaceae bacterium]|nr:GIY-YIG nuclease family protein [Bacteroidaceae bacterium]